MKITVVSNDGNDIATHFGRAKYFIMFKIEGGKIVDKELVKNKFTSFVRGECKGGKKHSHEHTHENIINFLHHSKAVISRGIGFRAYNDLENNGIAPIITDISNAREAVNAYIKGGLENIKSKICQCSHAV